MVRSFIKTSPWNMISDIRHRLRCLIWNELFLSSWYFPQRWIWKTCIRNIYLVFMAIIRYLILICSGDAHVLLFSFISKVYIQRNKRLIPAGNDNTFNFKCKFSCVLYEWIHSVWNTSLLAFISIISLGLGKNRNIKVRIRLNKCKSNNFQLGRLNFCHRIIYSSRRINWNRRF